MIQNRTYQLYNWYQSRMTLSIVIFDPFFKKNNKGNRFSFFTVWNIYISDPFSCMSILVYKRHLQEKGRLLANIFFFNVYTKIQLSICISYHMIFSPLIEISITILITYIVCNNFWLYLLINGLIFFSAFYLFFFIPQYGMQL